MAKPQSHTVREALFKTALGRFSEKRHNHGQTDSGHIWLPLQLAMALQWHDYLPAIMLVQERRSFS